MPIQSLVGCVFAQNAQSFADPLGTNFIYFQLWLIMQDRAQQRIVNLDVAVVIDESKFAKLVHKKADTGSGGADHVR
jgi:hypothetical protein